MMRIVPQFAVCVLLIGALSVVGYGQYKDSYEAGRTAQRARKYADARNNYEEALKVAGNGTEKAAAQLGIASAYDAEQNYTAARAEFEKALAIEGATADQKAQAQFNIGTGWYSERKYPAARTELEKVLAMPEVSATWRQQAQTFIAHCWYREYKMDEAKAAYALAGDMPGTSTGKKVEARNAIVNILFIQKKYADVRAELVEIIKIPDLSPGAAAQAQVNMGRAWLLEGNCTEARNAATRAMAMEGLSSSNKVDAQLYLGLSYYKEGNFKQAGPELQKVLTMPGATEKQVHEATLKLHLRKLIPTEEKHLTVLFIGASHTQVLRVPQMVEVLAASAPAGCPRIIAGEFLRGGTTIEKFWEEGDGPETARDTVASEPWDYVNFESYPFISGYEKCVTYATKFSELARAHGAKPVLFDAPSFFRAAYPAAYQKNHGENVTIATQLGVPVAAVGEAWIQYLGPKPTDEQRMTLYHPDAVHTSRKGSYLIACSIYSAITGLSPVGLTHDFPSFGSEGISAEDAAALQQAAWKAYQASNGHMKSAE